MTAFVWPAASAEAGRGGVFFSPPAGGGGGFQGPLGSLAPGQGAPFGLGEPVLSADREDIGHMPFARAAAPGDGEDEFDLARVDLLSRARGRRRPATISKARVKGQSL